MSKKRLLLVGWDSADWKLINPLMDTGAMPTLERLVNNGTSGNLTTLEPQLSPMLWTSRYIDEIPEDNSIAVAETNRENDWNMARAYMYAGKAEQALPLLEKCYHAQPFRSDYAQVLANCHLQLSMLEEADATIDQARDHFCRTENADLFKASIACPRINLFVGGFHRTFGLDRMRLYRFGV